MDAPTHRVKPRFGASIDLQLQPGGEEAVPWELREGEPVITVALVRALLAEQHPDLARLPVGDSVRGWDNTMVRLGERLAVRLPRHHQAEGLLDREVAWLPVLARQLGAGTVNPAPGTGPEGVLPFIPTIPTPARTGVPGAGFPFRWVVVPWVAGTPAVRVPAEVRDAYAPELAAILRTIHQPAPEGAPASTFRGIGLADVAERFDLRWHDIVLELPADRRDQLSEIWAEALAAPRHVGPRVWLHGDPHPNNTVLAGVEEGSGVNAGSSIRRPVLVDYGDLCAGDPASDLGAALLHFSPAGQRTFREAYTTGRAGSSGQDAGSVTDALWRRAGGWAVYFALIFAAQPAGEPLRPLGRNLLL